MGILKELKFYPFQILFYKKYEAIKLLTPGIKVCGNRFTIPTVKVSL